MIPLRTRQGRRLRFLSWTPAVAEGRSPLKLDVLRIEFRRGDKATQVRESLEAFLAEQERAQQ